MYNNLAWILVSRGVVSWGFKRFSTVMEENFDEMSRACVAQPMWLSENQACLNLESRLYRYFKFSESFEKSKAPYIALMSYI